MTSLLGSEHTPAFRPTITATFDGKELLIVSVGSSSDTLDTLGRGNRPTGAINELDAMDIVQMEVNTSENIKSNFADASSDQVTTSTHVVRGSFPEVNHVHSIEPATLLWLLLVYVAVRTLAPILRYRSERNGNGNGNGQGNRQRVDSVLVEKPKPKPKAKAKAKAKTAPRKRS